MRTIKNENGIVTHLWISARETSEWADGETPKGFAKKHTGRWPCSTLRGKRVFFGFDHKGDLCDLTVNGRYGAADIPGDEASAIIADAIGDR